MRLQIKSYVSVLLVMLFDTTGCELQPFICFQSVDKDIAGFTKVDRLATFLFSLRAEERLALRNDEAELIFSLWSELDEYENSRIPFQTRH